eukprot:9033306-Pyramimonas_sp.AAC.1
MRGSEGGQKGVRSFATTSRATPVLHPSLDGLMQMAPSDRLSLASSASKLRQVASRAASSVASWRQARDVPRSQRYARHDSATFPYTGVKGLMSRD